MQVWCSALFNCLKMESRCNLPPIISVFSYCQHVFTRKQLKYLSHCLALTFVLPGHFLLTNLLLDNMKATAKSTGIEGRIVNLSSVAHAHTYPKGIEFDRINDEKRYVWIYGSLWGLTVEWTASNDLLLTDTMIKWLMDNLSWQTYCTQMSSLDGSRYYFILLAFSFILIFWEGLNPEVKHVHHVPDAFGCTLQWSKGGHWQGITSADFGS